MIAVDPTGKDIVFILAVASKENTGNDNMFLKAAQTRKADIESSKGFDATKDKVVILQIQDLADIECMIYENIKELSPTYRKTREVDIYSHNGELHGPMGDELTSNEFEVDYYQMSTDGWGEIEWNWGDKKNVFTL